MSCRRKSQPTLDCLQKKISLAKPKRLVLAVRRFGGVIQLAAAPAMICIGGGHASNNQKEDGEWTIVHPILTNAVVLVMTR